MVHMLNSGVDMRWLNTAGFEIILPSGAHVLTDPWLDSSTIYPISLDSIERVDYILLSHIHFDHAQDIASILKKFPKAKLFVGDLSTDALCHWQHVSLTNIYRVRSGEEYIFDDITIQAYAGRHTENAKGVYRDATVTEDARSLSDWYGSLEMLNYNLTASDGTRILVWGGMTSADQMHRLQGLKSNIALMHLSPKQDPEMFSDMVKAIGTPLVIPHHHDMTEPLFNERPELIDLMLPASAKEAYLVDGKFNTSAFVGAYNKALKQTVPYATLMELEHHKWYHFGLAYEMK